MQHTTNYKLKKPEDNDFINVKDLNDNADIIDAKLKEHKESAENEITKAIESADSKIPKSEKGQPKGVATLGTDGKVPGSQLPPLNYVATTDGKTASGTLQTTEKTNLVTAINEVKSYANDIKTKIANVIGTPATPSDTSDVLASHIQSAKDKIAGYITKNKGTADRNMPLLTLSDRLSNIPSELPEFAKGKGAWILNSPHNLAPFQDAIACGVEDKIYLWFNDAFYMFHSTINAWEHLFTVKLPGSQRGRMHHHEGKLYGVGGNYYAGRGITIIDLTTSEVRQGTSMDGQPVDEPASALIDGKIYVTGGFINQQQTIITRVYDIKTNAWNQIQTRPGSDSTQDLKATTDGKFLYTLEGGTYFRKFDPKTGVWSALPNAPFLTVKSRFFMEYIDGKIVVFGGIQSGWNGEETLFFDVATSTWTKGTPISRVTFGSASAVCNGFVYCIGGRDAQQTFQNQYKTSILVGV